MSEIKRYSVARSDLVPQNTDGHATDAIDVLLYPDHDAAMAAKDEVHAKDLLIAELSGALATTITALRIAVPDPLLENVKPGTISGALASARAALSSTPEGVAEEVVKVIDDLLTALLINHKVYEISREAHDKCDTCEAIANGRSMLAKLEGGGK